MATPSNNALFTPQTEYNAADMRQLVSAIYSGAGVVGSATDTSLKAAATSPQSLGVRVSAGRAVVQDPRLTAPLDLYLAASVAAYVDVVLAPADLTHPRVDAIVLRVRSVEAGDLTSSTTLEAVTGTPAGSPVAPAAPDGSLLLATVAVSAGASEITNANITDARTFATSALGGGDSTVLGYNKFYWTPNASDTYPLQNGTYSVYAGRPSVHPSATTAGGTVYRSGLPRRAGGELADGTITFSGAVLIQSLASAVGQLGLGLSTTVPTGAGWAEAVVVQLDGPAGEVKFFTYSGAGAELQGCVSGGTQRGSTISGLLADTWHNFELRVAADGTVTVTWDGTTVWSGAAGVDLLLATGAFGPAVGMQVQNSNALRASRLEVSYS